MIGITILVSAGKLFDTIVDVDYLCFHPYTGPTLVNKTKMQESMMSGFVVLASNTSSHKGQDNPSGKFNFVIEASYSFVHHKMYVKGLVYMGVM